MAQSIGTEDKRTSDAECPRSGFFAVDLEELELGYGFCEGPSVAS